MTSAATTKPRSAATASAEPPVKRVKSGAPDRKAATKSAPVPASGTAPSTPKTTAKRPFEVRTSGIHGRGVFATEKIAKGTRLIEYTGETIPWSVADRRYADNGKNGYHTFLFDIDGKKVIDARVGGNDSRWINHGCAPNCEAVGEGDRIFIEAIKAIKPGDELVYDYGFVFDERHTPALKARYKCLCGAKTCRGTMVAPKR